MPPTKIRFGISVPYLGADSGVSSWPATAFDSVMLFMVMRTGDACSFGAGEEKRVAVGCLVFCDVDQRKPSTRVGHCYALFILLN